MRRALLRKNASGGGGYLLDTYTGASVAYSFRKLSSSATYACKVLRSSDNATCDVVLESSGSITLSSSIANLSGGSGATLGAWIGSDSGFINIWYDQSGNGYDATQATGTLMPRIVNVGSFDTLNSLPTLDTSVRTNSYFTTTATVADLGLVSGFSSFEVGSVNVTDNNYRPYWAIWGGGTDKTILKAFISNGKQSNIVSANGTSNSLVLSDTTTGNNVQFSSGADYDGSTLDNYRDGSLENSGSALMWSGSSSALRLFNYGGLGSSTKLLTKSQEIIIFGSDQSANRTAIESDVNTYYTIY